MLVARGSNARRFYGGRPREEIEADGPIPRSDLEELGRQVGDAPDGPAVEGALAALGL